MKTVVLALAFSALAAIGASAVDQGQQSTSFSFASKAQNARQFTLAAQAGPRRFELSRPLKLGRDMQDAARLSLDQQIHLSPGLLESSSHTCLKLRTYRVKRIDNTDMTEPAGYTTCLRGNQVQMKSAVRRQQTNRDSGVWH